MAGLAGVNSGLEIPTGLNQLSGLSPGNGLVLSGNYRSYVLAGTYSSVVAAAFTDNSLIIRDPVTPANNYSGPLITSGAFNKFTYTNASANRTFIGSNGLIQYAAANIPRIEYNTATLAINGYLDEGTRTNLALWSRDMTNAAWVKTTMTTAETATGADGVANSATTLTATAGNATALQTITNTATDVYSVWLRRRTGSGTVQITQDNSAFTTVTLTTAWQRFQIPAAALTNPVIGVKIVTNGDAIDADFSQLETGGWPSSAIATTTVAVTRAADSLILNNTSFNLSQTAGTLYIKNNWQGGSIVNAGQRLALAISNASFSDLSYIYNGSGVGNLVLAGGVTSASIFDQNINDGVFSKSAAAYANNDFAFVQDGRTPVTASGGKPQPATTRLCIGGNYVSTANLFGTIPEFMDVGQRVSNAAMQSLTT